MKKNCQLYTAEQLWDEIFNYKDEYAEKVWITEDGFLHWVEEEGISGEMNPNECAYSINMPLYEVVMVDNEGEDEYALLFFES